MMIEEHRKYMKEWGYDVWALICVGSGTFQDLNDWFLMCLRWVFPGIFVPP